MSISSVEEFDARDDILIAPECLIAALIPVSITTHITKGPGSRVFVWFVKLAPRHVNVI